MKDEIRAWQEGHDRAVRSWEETLRNSADKYGGTPHRDIVDGYNFFLSRVPQIYFAQERGMGAIKIGTTQNVRPRIANLSAGVPYTLALLAVMNGDKSVESAVHRRFAHARIRGEWFRPVPELLEYIAGIAPLCPP